MNNTHMTVRYKNPGIQGVCRMVKFQELRGKIGMSGWGNKVHLITHIQGQELLPHERRLLNEIIQVALAGEVYGEVAGVADTVVAAEDQFLWASQLL